MLKALQDDREMIAQSIQERFDPQSRTFRDLAAEHFYLNVDMEEAYLVIYDAEGTPIYRSPIADMITLSVPMATDQPELITILNHDSESMPVFHPAASEQVRFHAVSRKLYHGEELIGWVNIASSMDDIDDSLRHLLRTLFGVKLIALFILLSGGYVITRKALKPVTAMTEQARRISTKNLDERIEVVNERDEIGRLAIVLNDLLERLHHAFISQQRFLADAAHELKTPIAILRTNWEDELNNPELSVEIKERFVADIETITRLSRVINDLLLLSQTESREKSFSFESLSFDDLVKDVADDVRVLAEMKQQQLTSDNIEPVKIFGDRDRLYQLVFNLLDNAVKYSGVDGSIDVDLSVADGWAKLSVRDNGLGIPPADLPHVFERFYRVDQGRSRQTGGSGLGLAIAKMITETHRGRISVRSELNSGTVFTVRLPAL